MSVSTEVQRTLVKSPPELWAELSDPDALSRHLGELGEVRITGVEPETKVEWEAEHASGIVHLKQSGWGTKVTLSVTRNPPVPEAPFEPASTATIEPEPVVEPEPELESIPEPEPIPAPEPVAVIGPEPVAVEPEPEKEPDPVAIVEPEIGHDPEGAATTEPEPKPHLGFFARLFRRRLAKPMAVVEPEPEPILRVEREVEPDPEPEVVALAAPEAIYPAPPDEPAADLATELESVEAQMAQETTDLLTSVLDRLGAAHHRPFSRG